MTSFDENLNVCVCVCKTEESVCISVEIVLEMNDLSVGA